MHFTKEHACLSVSVTWLHLFKILSSMYRHGVSFMLWDLKRLQPVNPSGVCLRCLFNFPWNFGRFSLHSADAVVGERTRRLCLLQSHSRLTEGELDRKTKLQRVVLRWRLCSCLFLTKDDELVFRCASRFRWNQVACFHLVEIQTAVMWEKSGVELTPRGCAHCAEIITWSPLRPGPMGVNTLLSFFFFSRRRNKTSLQAGLKSAIGSQRLPSAPATTSNPPASARKLLLPKGRKTEQSLSWRDHLLSRNQRRILRATSSLDRERRHRHQHQHQRQRLMWLPNKASRPVCLRSRGAVMEKKRGTSRRRSLLWR